MYEKKLIRVINQRIKQQIIEYMRTSLDGPTIVAEKFGISQATFYSWKRSDPDFAAALETQEEFKLDWVETKMHENINSNDSGMIQFYMKYKGKKKGFIEPRLQIDHTTNGESLNKIEVEIVYKTNESTNNEGL